MPQRKRVLTARRVSLCLSGDVTDQGVSVDVNVPDATDENAVKGEDDLDAGLSSDASQSRGDESEVQAKVNRV